MKVKSVITEEVPLTNTEGYRIFEIVISVTAYKMFIYTCLRTKSGDSTGYCAEVIEIEHAHDAAKILSLPFEWVDVKTNSNDIAFCKEHITKLFFEACKRQAQLHQ